MDTEEHFTTALKGFCSVVKVADYEGGDGEVLSVIGGEGADRGARGAEVGWGDFGVVVGG